MSAITDLTAADTLTLSQINWQLHLPLDKGDLSGSAPDVCLSKVPGQIAFTATLDQFGFPLSAPLTFTGAADAAGDAVDWKVDSGPISVSYMGYRITRIHGTLATSLTAATPALGLACSFADARLFEASLLAGDKSQTIDVDIDILGGVTANGSIQFMAGIGRVTPPDFFTVSLISTNRWQSDGCGGRYQLFTPPSTTIPLSAIVENANTTGSVTSTTFGPWTTHGPGHIHGQGQNVQLIVEGTGNISVAVTVTVETDLGSAGVAVGQIAFTALTADELRLTRAICRLKGLFHFIPERTPVGDPALHELIASFATPSLSAADLGRVQVAARRIAETASAVLKQADAVILERSATEAARARD